MRNKRTKSINIINVLLIANVSSGYGANRSMLEFIEEIKKFGVVPHVVIPTKGSIERELKKEKIKYQVIPYAPGTHLNKRNNCWKEVTEHIFTNIAILKQLEKLVAQWDINLVHTNSLTHNIGAILAVKYHIPHIWHIRELLLEDYQLKFDFKILHKRLLRRAAAVICISDTVYRKFGGINHNTYTIMDGFETVRYYHKRERYGHDNCLHILMSGMMTEGKGQLEAVQAIRKYIERYDENIHLVFAGNGDTDYQRRIKAYINKYGLQKHIEFVGYVDDLSEYRKAADVGLICSKKEALGRVTIEGMLSGLVMVGANSGGTTEVIEDGVTGYLYSLGDISKLADVLYTIHTNPQKQDMIINKAQEAAIMRFDISKYTECISAIYKSIVASKHCGSKKIVAKMLLDKRREYMLDEVESKKQDIDVIKTTEFTKMSGILEENKK